MIKVIQKLLTCWDCNQSSMSILETIISHLRSDKFKNDFLYKIITIKVLTFYNILRMIGTRSYVWLTYLFKANLCSYETMIPKTVKAITGIDNR